MLQSGLMMDRPLLISAIIEHGAAQFGDVEVVSRETHGPLFRYGYAQCAARARKLANALQQFGLQPGDIVGSIAWNNHCHLEAYYAVSGGGMVMHTCNPRLHVPQLAYILNHAEDRIVLFDTTFAPLVKELAKHCPGVGAWICLSDAENMPDMSGVEHVICYEDFIAAQSEQFAWPDLDERTGAALCYTSGTTGDPKGVLYSHRAIVLNAMSGCVPDVMSLSTRETVLPVVPMFHINAWCIPYAAPIAGARLVLPGPRLDGPGLYELMEAERVTVSAGVPTIWGAVIQHMESGGLHFSTLRRTLVGGSAMPAALIEKFARNYGVEVRHAWGMTETTAVTTVCTLGPQYDSLADAEKYATFAKQGRTLFGAEQKVVDDGGATLPRDGASQGELMVRGSWIVERYFKAGKSPLIDGWFPTGDIATIDANGLMQIRDRAKDVIKSGGEWISSIDLEGAAMQHAAVALVAVIGVKHPKWEERPLMFVVRKPGAALECDELLAFLTQRVAKWWLPEDVIFLDALPLSGTGKVLKTELRKQYGGVFS